MNERHILQIWKETEVTQFFCEFLNFMGVNPPMAVEPAPADLLCFRKNSVTFPFSHQSFKIKQRLRAKFKREIF